MKLSISLLPRFSKCRISVPPCYYQFLLDKDICEYLTKSPYKCIDLSARISPGEDLGFYCHTLHHNHVYLNLFHKSSENSCSCSAQIQHDQQSPTHHLFYLSKKTNLWEFEEALWYRGQPGGHSNNQEIPALPGSHGAKSGWWQMEKEGNSVPCSICSLSAPGQGGEGTFVVLLQRTKLCRKV